MDLVVGNFISFGKGQCSFYGVIVDVSSDYYTVSIYEEGCYYWKPDVVKIKRSSDIIFIKLSTEEYYAKLLSTISIYLKEQ